ncbi:MAG TPA: hypothetical protein VNZ57_10160, partial [Longimicrobiales bacterium]|nr:hypothetical protein [Longimicrobiales bacterium]
AGISRRIGPGWFVGVSAEIRRTDFLPRRYDLNLLPQPVASDQHGRAVHGSLIRHGSLVAVEPGTNRRFSDFDAVSAVNADGRSEYRGVTLSAQGTPAPGVDLAASYTYSRTLDDWPAGGAFVPDAQLPPLPGADGGPDWRYGTSDFDIPHRFVATAALRLPLPFEVRIAGAYSYRSGVPFTPGFRPGVDANGDGSARNDPAFVDDRIDGIGALLGRWPCLADQAGTFAERNSCRGPAIHGMDARLSATVVANDRYRIALTLDAVNLVESVSTELDAALYLVDPDNPLVSNPAAGTVALPLATNPDFGEPLARRTSGRAFRIGFRLDY